METLFVLMTVCVCIQITICVQCLDQTGSPVEWFIVYKIPRLDQSTKSTVRNGTGFYYMDVNSFGLKLADRGLDDTGHAVYNTLDQIYHNKTEVAYIMYNDQLSNSTTSYYGHTKGVTAFDKNGGFWIVHSTPKFPLSKSYGYRWPENGLRNGQTFLCISMAYGMIDNIGTVFNYTYPNMYDIAFPDIYVNDHPKLATIVKSKLNKHQKHVTSPPWYDVIKLTTTGNNVFLSFSKYTKFGEDLYDALLSVKLDEDLLVQSWIETERTPGDKLPSNCSISYKVYNINTVQFQDNDITFNSTKDHSKWAVSKENGNWLCIGDINRQKTQFHRSGGQVCFQNNKAWKSFRSLVKGYETC